jgi:hypothetical protein
MNCTGCGAAPVDDYAPFDYCAECGRVLCSECMAGGCCKQIPAPSGHELEEARLEA